ncbi:cbb3-type cytochrome c oxidase subunit III [Pseudomonas duriflava]|uniref:Cbb3-type cytochrome c oxidase subunit III n=1 Tax=Pseudomonas duriflava TaxID=459528 RepID=A0A562QIR1_9PSED|nr:c-type cytochrome [Pseudomonas duriflava]TWI56563.1 cbb3-type cytochrome c oxidase subunit III [Pseudomonas duriflava]
MNILIASLLLFAALTGMAQAAGSIEAGQGKSVVCGACHGVDGNSVLPNFPKIAGQGERYLVEQLRAIKRGDRVVPKMMAFMPALSDQDIQDLAAYYAAQKHSIGAADPALVAAGELLYRGGQPEQGVPACTGCHSPEGVGNAQAGFPLLSGQHAAYTAKQLRAYRQGRRTTDGEAMIMRSIARRLSDTDIAALATYIEGLH